MRATANFAPTRNGRRHLLESCAIMAGLAALAHGGPALAQVAGAGQGVTGPGLSTPTISPPGPGPTTVTTTGDQTIINWTPSNAPVGGVIDFLPTGNALNFTGTGQYIVLNRFVSGAGLPIADQIAINGTVNSIDFATSGGRGGNIWFYNAGGILIGATGVLNVGSLVLTANDVLTAGGLLGPSGEIRFRGASGSTSAITVNGAINANNALSPGSSYVALVAPRVVQAGAVRVDGSVGYVAAEQADIRINGGLFDINVLVGAEGGNVITHTGTTGGPGHVDSNPNDSRVYMVAIPKNLAVTMLVSGQIGYDAVSAQVDPNGAVRLSAGYNITNGELNDTPVNATAANITVGDTLFSSSVVAHASGTFAGRPDNMIPPSAPLTPQTGKIIVLGDADFGGDTGATLTAGADQAIEVDGTLSLQSLGQLQADGSRQGGNATLSALGGSVTAGFITVASIGAGGIGTGGDGGDGAGGDAAVLISGTGSTLTANGLNIQSTGIGGGVTFDSSGVGTAVDNSGNGTGGNATLTVENGGALSINGQLSVAAAGIGQTGNIQSGSGTGGTTRINVTGDGTSFNTLGTSVSADGVGGTGISQSLAAIPTENGGAGTGGSAAIEINAPATTIVNMGAVAMSANGIGGDSSGIEGATGADGTGGTVSLSVDGGIAVDMTDLALSAVAGSGGALSPSNLTAASGDAVGGTVMLAVANGSSIINDGNTSINVSGLTSVSESIGNGTGGDVVISATTGGLFSTDGNTNINAAGGNFVSSGALAAGTALGGNIDLTADSGTITTGSFFVDAGAQRPNADTSGGAVTGGTIDLTAINNGTISATNSGGFNEFLATASSGAAANDVLARGGTIQMIADGGTISMANFASFSASGVSGGNLTEAASPLESGVGGTVLIRVRNSATGTGSMTFDDIFFNANGATQSFSEGINAGNGAAGAVGGTATFDMQSGTFTATLLDISANGIGGIVAGTGRGGTATFTQTGGTVTVGTLSVSASGRGGFDTAVSGLGIGGTATINLFGGALTGGNVSASADGTGGNGANGDDDDPALPTPTGRGGNGQGGTATINIDGTAVVQTATLAAYAGGEGGEGGAFFVFNGVAGDGGDGGDGLGGSATINILSGTLTTNDLIVDAGSIGGDGGNVLASSSSGSVTGIGVGGTGGRGQGGIATIDFATGFTATGTVNSASTGSGGAGGFGTVGGGGGGGIGGLAQVIVTDFDAGALALTVNASADGGNGGFGDDGAGGNGGTASGGTGRIEADGANANISVTQANFVTAATGGNGGSANSNFFSDNIVGGAGGNGGDATGGTLEIAASNGATVAMTPETSGIVSLSSAATGGNGGNGAFNGFGGMRVGGDGGIGGGGAGGTVRLSANGGTITSNGSAVDITVSGASGAEGSGGTGTAGNGAAGGVFGTTGGRAVIDTSVTSAGMGAIALGTTTIAANGDSAGRIEIRNTGNISFASLTAEALGSAPPTNNDTDEAPAGIFLAATGGTISTSGDMTLTTDSSLGTYAQSNGTVAVGGDLSITAADQIDIRHDLRVGTAPTITASGNLTATAGSISSAPGSLLDAGGTLSLTSTLGGIGIDRLDGNNIVIAAAGAASVEHAEATNDFTASGASFRTGLNSIITGGDILITSPGAVDLGNSTAGGFVQVDGQSIVFNNIDAGFSVFLNATGNTLGAQGITGGSIAAGGNINLNASVIAIGGTLAAGGSLFASGSAGPVAIALANVVDDITIVATGDITGAYNAEGDIRLTSGANIGASANATGFESSSSGTPIAASVFVDADGDVAMTDSSAAGMFGVRAGGSASMNGANIGEDLLVLAGTTATLTDITAGDDLTVTAPGGIIANGIATTGTGPDDGTLTYGPFSPPGPSFFQINFSPPNDSNIVLTASAGGIGGGNMAAFDNLALTAAGAVTTTGTLASGLATSIDGDSIGFAAIDAGSTVDLSAVNAISGADIAAGSDINLTGDSIALTGAVTGGASLFALGLGGAVAVNQADVAGTISIFADGNLTGTYIAGGDIRLNSNANVNASATANGGFADPSGIATQGNLFVEAAGDVVLANSAAARMFGVSAGGSATITGGNAGEDMLVIAGTTASLNGITAGDDVDVRAGGDLTATGVNSTGAGADTAILGFVAGNGFTISSGEGVSATDGSDVRLSAGGSIGASALSAGDDIFAFTPGTIAISGAATQGLGVIGSSSDIQTQGGDTTLAGLDAFTDVLVASTGAINITGPVEAGRNVTMTALAADLQALATPGGTFIDTVRAGNNLTITTSGDITGGRVSAGGDLLLTGDSIAIVRAQTTGTGQLTLTGPNGVNADSIQAGGATLLDASNGAVTSNGLASGGPVTATGNSIDLRTNGNIVFAVLDADVGDAAVTSTSGSLTITSSVVAGRAALSSLSSGDIVIDQLAANVANATTQGDIIINNVLTARNIALQSNDITIASGARVGTAGSTEALSIENNDVFRQTFVGGTGTRSGFHLDAAELTRLFGTNIEVFAPNVEAANNTSVGSSAPPDVIIDSFTVAGGAAGSNLGANGALTIRTPGKMRVIGNVRLTGLSDTNALNLFADDALEVILGQGTVRLVNGSAAAGQLNMVSDDIIVATTAAINDVGAATTTDAIEARLAQNDGVVLDEGSLFARGIRAEIIGGFYVQNSGSGTDFASRRGLTFGAGGLDVLTEGSGSRIVVNGVQIGPNGQVTGLDTVPLLTIGGSAPSAGSFDPRSTFNGCFIANPAACGVLPPPEPEFESSFPVQDVIEEEADAEDEDGNGQSLPVPLITMRDLDPLSGEPLLDDPVTGAGNDDLWTPTEQP
ncbi:hypothetical protein [Sphingopyxis sp.]|uniref:hypothetical protein n=1 Tax=Sphingopyxis sp. TaxID=1908224 RepID=UPI0025D0130B|nr:hypothetical protein [Sphingopyxis sp.]MBK6413316.1 hypothetical protein [Sphingopyxis sp.]